MEWEKAFGARFEQAIGSWRSPESVALERMNEEAVGAIVAKLGACPAAGADMWRARPARQGKLHGMAALQCLLGADPCRPEVLSRVPGFDFELLGRLTHRRRLKVGVIFVPLGALDEQEKILAVSERETTPHFREFLAQLGWRVKVASHLGYRAGLDPKGSTGSESVYFSDFTNEVMFHVGPLFPAVEDTLQVAKKRHIGNDPVQIVWLEGVADYDTGTVTSQFNNVHIVVRPLETGAYQVSVRLRTPMARIASLEGSVILSKRVLAPRVRAAAIEAMLAYQDAQVTGAALAAQNEMVSGLADVRKTADRADITGGVKTLLASSQV